MLNDLTMDGWVTYLNDLTRLGLLKKTKVTASSGLMLIMSFAKEIGLAKELERRLANTIGELAKRFTLRDIHNMADRVMKLS